MQLFGPLQVVAKNGVAALSTRLSLLSYNASLLPLLVTHKQLLRLNYIVEGTLGQSVLSFLHSFHLI